MVNAITRHAYGLGFSWKCFSFAVHAFYPTSSDIDSSGFSPRGYNAPNIPSLPLQWISLVLSISLILSVRLGLSTFIAKHDAFVPSLWHQPRIHHSKPNRCSHRSQSFLLSHSPLYSLAGPSQSNRNGHNITILRTPNLFPLQFQASPVVNESRTQSIIATPGIETAPFVHAQRLQLFPASADVQLW